MAIPENDTQLWAGFNDHGLYAKRAERDKDGNPIDTTYATKDAATTTAAGLMSAADKARLDTIESGAEVNLIETVSVAGTALKIESKSVNVPEAGGTAGAWVKGVVSGEDTARWDSWVSAVFPIIPKPNIVVIGGRAYPTVKIGNQLWLAENLDWKADGIAIGQSSSETSARAIYYNNDEATYGVNGNKSGLLYNQMCISIINNNLPSGWRIPSDSDFNSLIQFVGSSALPLKSTTGWNPNGTDLYGFNGKQSGRWDYNRFVYGGLWMHSSNGNCYYLIDAQTNVGNYSPPNYMGLSIRLVKSLT